MKVVFYIWEHIPLEKKFFVYLGKAFNQHSGITVLKNNALDSVYFCRIGREVLLDGVKTAVQNITSTQEVERRLNKDIF